MIDALTYLVRDPVAGLAGHLTAPAAKLPIYPCLLGSALWDIKGDKGWPWDSFPFDQQYVYNSVTENGWASASAFKVWASKSWPGAGGGIVWMPRFISPGTWNAPVVTADTTYRTYSDCAHFAAATLGGPVETQVHGPFPVFFGGTLGAQNALVQTYKWGPSYVNMEVNYYVAGYGRVQWELWRLVNGLYVMQQRVAYNTLAPGAAPALAFPCALPVLP